MKRLITVEEHFVSAKMQKKVSEIINLCGTEAQKKRLKFAGGLKDQNEISDIGAGRIAYMDAHGIDAQILSYSSGNPATLPPQYAVPLCREVNDEIYEATQLYPGRFYGLAHLPISDPQEAVKEFDRAVNELHFKGAMFNGRYGDRLIDDEWFLPIYEKAAELDVPLYIHPGTPDKKVIDYYYRKDWAEPVTVGFSGFGIGWHYDIGVQIVRLILSGVFDRFPTLKIIIGHWGEVVAYYAERMDEIGKETTQLKLNISEYFKRNIYTNPSGMYYTAQFRFCLDMFGVDHILWGQDYPYRKPEAVRSFLEEFDISEENKEKIAYQNAKKLLKL